jgi:hypothetical protein
MQADRHIWRIWASKLHRWGLSDWVATILEAAGPLTILGAQLIYMGEPLIKSPDSSSHLSALANLLEDGGQRSAFAAYLRECKPQ